MQKELKFQFEKHIRNTLSTFLVANPDYRMMFTGHSLGGGFATGLFLMWGLHCKTVEPGLENIPVTLITFAAPTMIHSALPEAEALAEVQQLCDPNMMHHFVNHYDVVPRILGGQYHETTIKTLAEVTGFNIGNTEEIKNYKAIGNYYYIKYDDIYSKIYNSTTTKKLLLELPLALSGLVSISFLPSPFLDDADN